MMADAQVLEPVGRELAENLALAGDGRRQYYVEGRDPVCVVEEQVLVVKLVNVLDLARPDERPRWPYRD